MCLRSALLRAPSFAAYKVPLVSEALLEADGRGVEITLILECPEQSQGKVTVSAINAFGEQLAALAKVFVWP